MEPVEIKVYATYISVAVDHQRGTLLDKPTAYISSFIKRKLTEYDYEPRQKRFVPTHQFIFMDKATNLLHLPRFLLKNLEMYITGMGYELAISYMSPVEAQPVAYKVATDMNLRNDQLKPVEFMSDPDRTFTTIELGCGTGKTFMSITAIAKLGTRALIIVPPFVYTQWMENLLSIFNLNDEVYIIQGIASLRKLLDDPDATTPNGPPIILASSKTLTRYAKVGNGYEDLPPFEEFIRKFKFGVKILDEVHVNFYLNTIIDLRCNIKKNIYLSATYDRSSKSSKRIFDRVFPKEIRYSDTSNVKHVNVTELTYYTGGSIGTYHTSTGKGYSQFKYEKYLMKYENRLQRLISYVFMPIIESYFMKWRKDGHKLLIVVGLKEFAHMLQFKLHEQLKGMKIKTFLAGDPDTVLAENDIIISTIGSMGTGKDVSNLTTIISFTSIASSPQNTQLFGRLRPIDGINTEFVYMVNKGVQSHIRHANIRRQILRPMSKSFNKHVM